MELWIIGWVFSIGIVVAHDGRPGSWKDGLGILELFFLWPAFLGFLAGKVLKRKK